MKLTEAALSDPRDGLEVPAYDRSLLTPGIVHIGVGHFHRSHQAMYLDRLFALDRVEDRSWGIWGITMGTKSDDALRSFREQDGLYTLTEKFPDGERRTRVIGSILGIDNAATDHDAVIARLAAPATRIISLTVTEGGYGIDPASGSFVGQRDARIAADLASADSSASWLGLLVQALRLRRELGGGPITLLSCDNIPDNGEVAREALLSFAAAVAPELIEWIEENLTFPSSMVDRVTPVTTDADREYLSQAFGLEDSWAVICEPFSQWVVADDFANGRPELQLAGVDVVADVAPYEQMKLRLANGTHQALCFIGRLVDKEYVHEAIADADIHGMLLRYIDEEAVPTLQPIPGVDLGAWGRSVLERFGNPQLEDPIARICAETSDRIPKFLLPVVRDRLSASQPATVCAAVVAAWARYARGVDEHGEPIEVQDPRRQQVVAAALAEQSTPGSFLGMTEIFGELGDDASFAGDFRRAFELLDARGARALAASLAEHSSESAR